MDDRKRDSKVTATGSHDDLAARWWLFDLDGVIWLADEAIPGAAAGIGAARSLGVRVAFFSNNSFTRAADSVAKLGRFGIEVEPAQLLTSAEAAAELCEPGERALVVGGPGIVEALEVRGVEVALAADAGDRDGGAGRSTGGGRRFDAVVVGLDPHFDYARLSAAATAVLGGARLIATNDDATLPAPRGPLPGAGSLVAAVSRASGSSPSVAGKPNEPAAALVRKRLGEVEVMVGDRPGTDGALARRLGAVFGLVLTGVTRPGHGALDPEPDVEAPDLPSLVEALAQRPRAS